jgi:formate dehydrogenase major subunit
MSYWQNFPKFFISLQKAWWGDAARAENHWGFEYLPKLDKIYDMLQVYELMYQGKFNGYLAQGFNPLAAAPNKAKMTEALSKLKFLVIMDPLATETSEFWRNFGPHHDVDSSKIKTEVIRLPTTCFAEEDGALVNSGRWLQWHWKGAEPPGEARSDIEIMAGLFTRLRALYQSEGGAFPDPIVNLNWPYANASSPRPEELAKEYSGKALADVTDPKDATKVIRKAGEQLAGFAELRVVMASEPSRALQPCFVRSQRQAIQSAAQAGCVGRQTMGRRRYARLQTR